MTALEDIHQHYRSKVYNLRKTVEFASEAVAAISDRYDAASIKLRELGYTEYKREENGEVVYVWEKDKP